MRRRLPVPARVRSAALPLHRHSLLLLAIDGAMVAASYWLAYRLRFDDSRTLPPRYEDLYSSTIAWVVVSSLVVFTLFRLEQKQWRYTGSRDLLAISQAVVAALLALVGYIAIVHPVTRPSSTGVVTVSAPVGVLAFHFLLMLALVGGARLAARVIYDRPLQGFRARRDARRVLVVGAGDGGRLVLREILRNPQLGLAPVGFVDDDPAKRGTRIDGVKVLGSTDQLGRILDEVEPDEITI
ncbi:MAG: polysaccharide biosynthesis protein, partial [Actinomycetota bacterium]|nr:polysaccharide biosynthesis protein [Actinomycetota bacterium]